MGMKLGSLFDGSGGFPLAGKMCGIEPVWASEIEPYPIAVTRYRFPQMKHLGSVVRVSGGEIEPVDVITFGSPCQDLSVAGKRAGIHDGQRSNLFFEAIRIIKEMREATNGRYQTFAVWENVPGAFSSNRGEDFRCVLEELAQIAGGDVSIPRPAGGKWHYAGEIMGDGYSIAWSVLDAQYWGVPQRRKRIYLVADFAGERAGKILFERESLRGHPAQGGAPGQGAAADTAGRAGRSHDVRCLNPWDSQTIRQYAVDGVFHALSANNGGGLNRAGICFAQNQRDELRDLGDKTGALAAEQGMHQQNFVALKCMNQWDCQSKRIYQLDGVFPTLTAMDCGGANNQAVLYALDSMSSNSMKSANPHSGFHAEPVAKTLQADASPCIDRGQNFVCVQNTGYGWWNQGDIEETLRTPAGGDSTKANLVVECYDARGNGDGIHCPTLTGDHKNRVTDYTAVTVYRSPKFGEYAADGTASTMAARDFKSPRDLVVDHHTANGVDFRNGVLDEVKTHTLQAKANGGQSLNCTPGVLTYGKPPRRYIIRRLTPLECCRLHGFPDGWGIPDHKDKLSDEELAFWQCVRDTCAAISGKPPKKHSAEALTKWYNGLHTDSAEYKMWGNGVALPCVAFVMEGIAEQW